MSPKFIALLLMVSSFLGSGLNVLAADHEGGTSSGGGNVLVCFDDAKYQRATLDPKDPTQGAITTQEQIDHIQSIQTVDLYEAKKGRGTEGTYFPPVLEMAPGQEPLGYVHTVAHRFQRSIPAVSEMLTKTLKRLPRSHIIPESHGVIPVKGVNLIGDIDRERCVLATIAVQENINGQLFLHVDTRLYNLNKYSSLDRGVLMLHEIVQFNERENKKPEDLTDKDSSRTRLLVNAMITLPDPSARDDESDPVRVGTFLELAKSLGFDFGGQEGTFAFRTMKELAQAMYFEAYENVDRPRVDAHHYQEVRDAETLMNAILTKKENIDAVAAAQKAGATVQLGCSNGEQCWLTLSSLYSRGYVDVLNGKHGVALMMTDEQRQKAGDLSQAIRAILETRAAKIEKEMRSVYAHYKERLVNVDETQALFRGDVATAFQTLIDEVKYRSMLPVDSHTEFNYAFTIEGNVLYSRLSSYKNGVSGYQTAAYEWAKTHSNYLNLEMMIP